MECASSSSSSAAGSSCMESGKLFVGGISDAIKEEDIRDYFSNKYGEVKEAVVVKDKVTGNGRGFGFVQFFDPVSALKALCESEKHVIGDRTVEVKRAKPRAERRNNQSTHHLDLIRSQNGSRGISRGYSNGCGNHGNLTNSKKIFVGGLSSNVTEDEFRGYFDRFGRITDAVIMYDNVTQRPRGFGFITYDSEEAVESVMQKSFHQLNNKLVEVKRAVPKDGNNHNNFVNYNITNGNVNVVHNTYSFNNPNDFNYSQNFYNPQGFYHPRYGFNSGYALPSASGFIYGPTGYGGGYTVGPCGGYWYGTPYVSPRSPWSGPGLMVGRQSPLPYGNAPLNLGCYNNNVYGGNMGIVSGVYGGVVCSGDGLLTQAGVDISIREDDTKTTNTKSVKLEVQEAS